MSEKGERAKALFEQGYNCAQAVLARFVKKQGTALKTQRCLRLLLEEVWAECARSAARSQV